MGIGIRTQNTATTAINFHGGDLIKNKVNL